MIPWPLHQARRVRWKIDLVIIPIFLITQALQSLDKAALNYANLFGYQEALGLHGNQFNYLSGGMSNHFLLTNSHCITRGGVKFNYMGSNRIDDDMRLANN